MDFFANDVIQKMVLTGKKESVDEVLKQIPVNPLLIKLLEIRAIYNLQMSVTLGIYTAFFFKWRCLWRSG